MVKLVKRIPLIHAPAINATIELKISKEEQSR